jgi:hypothetical protein
VFRYFEMGPRDAIAGEEQDLRRLGVFMMRHDPGWVEAIFRSFDQGLPTDSRLQAAAAAAQTGIPKQRRAVGRFRGGPTPRSP